MEPEVSVIVVTWNAMELVDRCIEAVLESAAAEIAVEIVVVDNGSTDGTIDHLKAHWLAHDSRVRLVETGVNGGMAAGNNAGMMAARGDYFLLLNSDAFLTPSSLAGLLDAAKRRGANCGCIVPTLLNEDGSLQRSVRGFPTHWRYVTEFFYFRRVFPRWVLMNSFYGAGTDISKPGRIDWATGACLMVPRSSVDTVGLMDEGFFMYGEEVEWLHRMNQAGLATYLEPSALVHHIGGGSSDRSKLYALQLENHIRYMWLVHGDKAALNTRRLIRRAMKKRSLLYRFLALVNPRKRTELRERSNRFKSAGEKIRRLELTDLKPPNRPNWQQAG